MCAYTNPNSRTCVRTLTLILIHVCSNCHFSIFWGVYFDDVITFISDVRSTISGFRTLLSRDPSVLFASQSDHWMSLFDTVICISHPNHSLCFCTCTFYFCAHTRVLVCTLAYFGWHFPLLFSWCLIGRFCICYFSFYFLFDTPFAKCCILWLDMLFCMIYAHFPAYTLPYI